MYYCKQCHNRGSINIQCTTIQLYSACIRKNFALSLVRERLVGDIYFNLVIALGKTEQMPQLFWPGD